MVLYLVNISIVALPHTKNYLWVPREKNTRSVWIDEDGDATQHFRQAWQLDSFDFDPLFRANYSGVSWHPPSDFSKRKHSIMTVTWVSCIYIELGKIGGLRPVWFNTWYFVNAGSFPQGDHHQPQGSHHCAANLVRRFLETVATDAACQLCGAAGVPTHRRGNLLESLGRKGGISDRFIQRVDSTNKPCGFPWCRGIFLVQF